MNCSRCGAVLADRDQTHRCAQPKVADRAKAEQTVIHPLALGEELDGRWRLERKLGQGSMGTVFLAQDAKEHRLVAVKVLSTELCRNSHCVARFEREARLLAALRHPNIVALHGIGRAGAVPFIVMKYLPGTTLGEHRKRRGGRLSISEMLRLLRQVCAGLACLHSHGLIHRDVKPSNVFVGEDGHITILDLGIARDLSLPALTQPGVMVGTPHYMAPEQIVGRGELDHRADLYSLGAVVYELVTGAPPFKGGSDFEVLRAHVRAPVPDASAVAPWVRPPVSRVVARALAKSPGERFLTASAMLLALEEACSTSSSETLDDEERAPGDGPKDTFPDDAAWDTIEAAERGGSDTQDVTPAAARPGVQPKPRRA
ncbi:MAG: serine/threonine protein kinase [Myxococcales bacterium]|nr:serine/threonine protein kinase [Myxococcales bacterium]